ncbi:MAG: PEP-CTERM sorting domain-containing protein [Roseimicrobium sp.]
MKYSLFAAAALLVASQASATVNLQFQVGSLRNGAGDIVPLNTTVILVSDTNGFSAPADIAAELLGVTIATGQTVGSGGKILRVVGASDISGLGNVGYVDGSIFDLTALGLTGAAGTAGTDLAIMWFPGLTGTASQVLAGGQAFGFYRTDTVDTASGADISFNVPADPGAYTLASLDNTPNLLGGISPDAFKAPYTVSPEPSRLMLVLLGVVGLITRRKRN